MFAYYMDAIMIILFLEEEVGGELKALVTYITSSCWLINNSSNSRHSPLYKIPGNCNGAMRNIPLTLRSDLSFT